VNFFVIVGGSRRARSASL